MFSQITPDSRLELIRFENKNGKLSSNVLNSSILFYKVHQILKKTKKQNEVFYVIST